MYIQKSINEHFYTDELLQNEHTFVTTTWIQMTAPPRLPCVLSLSMNYCFWCWDKRYWLAFEFSRNRIIYITPPPPIPAAFILHWVYEIFPVLCGTDSLIVTEVLDTFFIWMYYGLFLPSTARGHLGYV